jgi:hypothetical protein
MNEPEASMAELWASSSEDCVSEEEYYARWAVVRSIGEAVEKRTISREEVATWRPRPDHVITLPELIEESYRVP